MADVRSTFTAILGKDRSTIALAGAVIAIIMVMLVPLPTPVLDLLMALNLLLSVLIILIVLYNRDPLEFSIFPSVLLMSTIFGLALNISSTRLILREGVNFDGRIVRAFATFVTGSGGIEGMVIGAIIFIILIVVQVVVITKGATRISEVAARFALDGMAGKQMAIEAEFSSGAITEEEARRRKDRLQKFIDFYGAMDGASKFVSGNVKVGIVITFINVIGGLIVGMTLRGEPLGMALTNYVSLTIGDGLVSQLPSLLISVATGLIITRSASEGSFGDEFTAQFTNQPRVYIVTAVFFLILAFLPGFPWYILIPLALLVGYLGFRLSRDIVRREETKKKEQEKAQEKKEHPVKIAPVTPPDPMSLELGFALIPLVDKDKGAELLDRITKIRKEAAFDMGLMVPPIRIMDNMRLEPSEYSIKIKGIEMGRGSIRMGHYLAINPGGERESLPGEKTVDPAFGLPALWVAEEFREKAERSGYTVVDPPSIIATHMTEIIKKNASELLGRQDVQSILDTLKEEYSAVVDEVVRTQGFTVGMIQKILQGLLREQVSIRNMVVILETIGDYGSLTKDPSFLTEKVRQALGRQICLQYTGDSRELPVLTLDPSLEQKIIDSRVDSQGGYYAALDPDTHQKWRKALASGAGKAQLQDYYPVILCGREEARPLVRSLVVRDNPSIAVLSLPEVSDDMKITSLGEITLQGV
jgi:flagellar biosynthesis protein FlhA